MSEAWHIQISVCKELWNTEVMDALVLSRPWSLVNKLRTENRGGA